MKARLIVNAITLLNAAFGISAMTLLALGPELGLSRPATLQRAALLIIGALGPDMLDGLLARRWQTSSEVGAQLDVNADTTTFNLATALLIALTPVYLVDVAPLDAPGLLALGVAGQLIYGGAALVRSARMVVIEPPRVARGRYFWGMTTNQASLLTTALVLVAAELAPAWRRFGAAAVVAQAIVVAPLMVSRVLFADVPNHFVKGIVPRWPSLLCFGLGVGVGPAYGWAAFIYGYGVVPHLLRRPFGRRPVHESPPRPPSS